jgi:hypothetical protein
MGGNRKLAVVVLAVAGVVLAVGVLITVAGFTPRPFDRTDQRAMGLVENSLADRFTLEAARLSSTWTFTRDAPIVLRFVDGVVTLDAEVLEPGCYSGTVQDGAVLTLDDAHDLRFTSADSEADCSALP